MGTRTLYQVKYIIATCFIHPQLIKEVGFKQPGDIYDTVIMDIEITIYSQFC